MSFTLQPVQDNVQNQLQSTDKIIDAIQMLGILESRMQQPDKNLLSAIIMKLETVSTSLVESAEDTNKFLKEVEGI